MKFVPEWSVTLWRWHFICAGLAVMVLLVPINGVMASYQRKLQIAQMGQKDDRIKLMSEVLNGMKVIYSVIGYCFQPKHHITSQVRLYQWNEGIYRMSSHTGCICKVRK